MRKKEVSKEEYKQVVDEILGCRKSLEQTLGKYTVNAIDRLIMARIKIETITIKEAMPSVENKQTTEVKE